MKLPNAGELKAYPEMKDSGVSWLNQVPVHWGLLRGKFLFRCIDVRSRTGEEELLTVSSEHGVVPRSSATVTMFKAESYLGYKLCWPGDLVINSLWAWGRGLGVSRYHGIVSSAYGVYRLRPPFSKYCHYIHRLVRSTPFNLELRVRSKGIWISRLQLTDEAFLGALFPVPPVEEQAAIVRFLDHADRRIRRYIRAKQKLITLLEEQKQAIIHQAVTGQIDVRTGQPYPAFDVDWLGEVPKHWNVRRLKTICSMKSGEGITATSIEPTGQYPVYGGNGLRGYTSGYTHDGAYALIGRQGALCGNVHLGQGCFWASEHAVVADLHRGHVLEWFGAILEVMNLNQYSIAAAQPGLAVERILNLWLPVPDPREQALIGTYIRTQTANISLNIERARRQGDLLQDYRTRLIADVVTGKLDVRDAAAALPEVDPLAVDEVDDPLDPDVESTLEDLESRTEVTI